jgi:hypothetical protein
MKRMAIIELSPERLAKLLGLKAGVKIVAVHSDPGRSEVIRFKLESRQLPQVAPGELIMVVPFERVAK